MIFLERPKKRPSVMAVATFSFFLIGTFAFALVFHQVVQVFGLIYFLKILNLGTPHG